MSSCNSLADVVSNMQRTTVELAMGLRQILTRSHFDLTRVHNTAAHVIDTHEHAGDFKEW